MNNDSRFDSFVLEISADVEVLHSQRLTSFCSLFPELVFEQSRQVNSTDSEMGFQFPAVRLCHPSNLYYIDQWVELLPNAQIPHPLVGFDEGAANIAVLDQALAIGDAGFLGISNRRCHRRIRYANDQIGLHRVLASELGPQFLAGRMNQTIIDDAIGPGGP